LNQILFSNRHPLIVFLALFIGSAISTGATQAAFLDFDPPARSSAMGGNLVADPEGSDSFYFNPAGLGSLDRLNLSARYQALEPGLEQDSLSTSGLTAAFPLGLWGTSGLSWDHFGSNNLQEDRFRLDWGRNFTELKAVGNLQMGFSFSYLKQSYILSSALTGLSGSNYSGEAFSLGAGILYQPFPHLTLGFSADDLTQPNLGVVGVYLYPVAWRWGAAYDFSITGAGSILLTLSQDDLGSGLETQGGGEWTLPFLNLALRAGGDAYQCDLGMGWNNSFLSLDFAYLFSWGAAPSLDAEGLPANYVLELTFLGPEPSPPSSSPYLWLLDKARQAVQAKNWRAAEGYYSEAVKLNASDPQVLAEKQTALQNYNKERAAQYFALGQSAESQGYLAEAQRDDAWAVQLDPQEPQYQQAVEHLKTKPSAPVSVVADAKTASALSDPKVQDLLSQVLDLLAKDKKKEAMVLLTQAQNLYPQDPLLSRLSQSLTGPVSPSHSNPQTEQLLLEADLYVQKGRPDLARENWKKVLAIDSSNPQAKEKLAESQTGGAEKLLTPEENQKAQELYQKGLQAYLNGDIPEAVKDWQETLQIDPHNVNALNNLVRAKLESGETTP
jgi:tetratricopeptide (TPR) repeat protein